MERFFAGSCPIVGAAIVEEVTVSSHYRIDVRSPHFDDRAIPVEFVVLHYTAISTAATLELFANSSANVSAHFVIGPAGETYEVVPALSEPAKRAWHAGLSRFELGGRTWENFNDFSIGIELVNYNGNVFPYTDAQYEALLDLCRSFQSVYPALLAPERFVGHEQISGFRGKCDPGVRFDWERFFKGLFPEERAHPERRPMISESLLPVIRKLTALEDANLSEGNADTLWGVASTLLERAMAEVASR